MATTIPTPSRYMRYSEAADVLGVSARTVRKLAASRQIRAVKIGSCVRIAPDELARYCAKLPQK